MTKEEFIKLAVDSGYCNKGIAVKYATGREDFTEADFIEVSRQYERMEDLRIRETSRGRYGDRYQYGVEGVTTKRSRNPGDDRYER